MLHLISRLILILFLSLVSAISHGQLSSNFEVLMKNETNNSYKPATQVNKKFLPGVATQFQIKFIDIPFSDLHVVDSGAGSPGVRSQVIIERDGQKYFRFFIHPESESLYEPLIKQYGVQGFYYATPTSSTRTVLAWFPPELQDPDKAPFPPLFLKLSLAKVQDGLGRIIPGWEVRRSVGITKVIDMTPHEVWMKSGASVIPEFAGAYVDADRKLGSYIDTIQGTVFEHGLIVRDASFVNEIPGTELMPLFGLFVPQGKEPPLIIQLWKKSGKAWGPFLDDYLFKPFLEKNAFLMFQQGIMPEIHGQNVVVAYDPKTYELKHFYHRDVGSMKIDLRLRWIHGLGIEPLRTHDAAFDFKFERASEVVGDYFQTYFAAMFNDKHYGPVLSKYVRYDSEQIWQRIYQLLLAEMKRQLPVKNSSPTTTVEILKAYYKENLPSDIRISPRSFDEEKVIAFIKTQVEKKQSMSLPKYWLNKVQIPASGYLVTEYGVIFDPERVRGEKTQNNISLAFHATDDMSEITSSVAVNFLEMSNDIHGAMSARSRLKEIVSLDFRSKPQEFPKGYFDFLEEKISHMGDSKERTESLIKLAYSYALGHRIQECIWTLDRTGLSTLAQKLKNRLRVYLETAPIESVGAIPNSRGFSEFVYFPGGIVGVRKTRGIGPKKGDATNVDAEVWAYLVDELLDTNVVPVTVARKNGGADTSIQAYIPETRSGISNFREVPYTDQESFLYALDFVVHNVDRTDKNWLIRPGGGRVGIDHGLTYGGQDGKLWQEWAPYNQFKTDPKTLFNRNWPFVEKLKTLSDDVFRKKLEGHVPKDVIEFYLKRKGELVEALMNSHVQQVTQYRKEALIKCKSIEAFTDLFRMPFKLGGELAKAMTNLSTEQPTLDKFFSLSPSYEDIRVMRRITSTMVADIAILQMAMSKIKLTAEAFLILVGQNEDQFTESGKEELSKFILKNLNLFYSLNPTHEQIVEISKRVQLSSAAPKTFSGEIPRMTLAQFLSFVSGGQIDQAFRRLLLEKNLKSLIVEGVSSHEINQLIEMTDSKPLVKQIITSYLPYIHSTTQWETLTKPQLGIFDRSLKGDLVAKAKEFSCPVEMKALAK